MNIPHVRPAKWKCQLSEKPRYWLDPSDVKVMNMYKLLDLTSTLTLHPALLQILRLDLKKYIDYYFVC